MFTLLAYLAVVYVGAGLVIVPCVWVLRRRRLLKPAAIAVLVLVYLSLPLIPYGIVYVQTVTYGPELLPAVSRDYAADDVGLSTTRFVSYAVLKIQAKTADVYVVTPCMGLPGSGEAGLDGFTMHMAKTKDGWTMTTYDCNWADCGSADGNIFPPDPRGF